MNRIIMLVCMAHFLAHFYTMLLPPLFPVLSQEMDVSYTQLGLTFTVFNIFSALSQAPIGFLVDEYKPHVILMIGMVLHSLSCLLIGFTSVYWVYIILVSIAGIANSIYHPANYTILNRIPSIRIGRLFSYHTAAGLAGESISPILIVLLLSFLHWQVAIIVCCCFGLIILSLFVLNFKEFEQYTNNTDNSYLTSSENTLTRIKFLFSSPILMGLVFFIGISIIHVGITGFSVSAFHEGYGIPVRLATVMMSAWLVASPIGVLAGGEFSEIKNNNTIIISICCLIIALCTLYIALFTPKVLVCGILFFISGFFSGFISPLRDMLIRSITPKGQFGKVFGFVSTGFNIGGIAAPPVFGYVIDKFNPNWIFTLIALASFLTIFTVFCTHQRSVTLR